MFLILFILSYLIWFNFILCRPLVVFIFFDELRHLLKQQMESLTCVCTNFILYHIILFYSLTYFILFYFISLIIFLYDFIYLISFYFILYHPLVVFLLLMNCGMYTNRKWNYEHVFILPCWGKIYFLWFKMII